MKKKGFHWETYRHTEWLEQQEKCLLLIKAWYENSDTLGNPSSPHSLCFRVLWFHKLIRKHKLLLLWIWESKVVRTNVAWPDSSVGKEPTCNAGEPGSIPGSGRSAGEGIGCPPQYSWASLVAQLVKNLPPIQENWVRSLGWRRGSLPTPLFWPTEFHGPKSRTRVSDFYLTEIILSRWNQQYSL